MGRTLPSFNQLIRQMKDEDWGKFRRAFRREDQEVLDEHVPLSREPDR